MPLNWDFVQPVIGIPEFHSKESHVLPWRAWGVDSRKFVQIFLRQGQRMFDALQVCVSLKHTTKGGGGNRALSTLVA